MNSEASYMILEMNTVNVILTVNRATIVKLSANQMNFFIEIQYNFKIIYTQNCAIDRYTSLRARSLLESRSNILYIQVDTS